MTGRGPARSPSRATRCRSSTGSRPRRRRRSSPRGSSSTRGRATSSPTSFGRGGWVARAAVDRQRRAVSLESSPLTRMLAEVVLRPPDVRHLDAAFQGMAALAASRVEPQGLDRRPVRDPLRDVRADARRRRDHLVGRRRGRRSRGRARPVARHYRCTVCRDQRGGSRAAPGAARRRRPAPRDAPTSGPRRCARPLRARFPGIDGAETLVDELLDLHTPRQLVGLGAILERIEGDLRAAPVLAALRLALLHAILPASRLATGPGRTAALRDRVAATSGRRAAIAVPRAQPVARLRGRVPAASAASSSGSRAAPPARSRRGSARTCGASARGPRPRSLGARRPERAAASCATIPTAYGRTRADARASGSSSASRRCARASSGSPPPTTRRPGSSVARRPSLLPIDALAGASLRAPWSWQAAAIGRALEAVEPSMARDGRVVQLVDGGPEALVAAVLGGARRRLPARSARGWPTPTTDAAAIVELLPPGGRLPPGAADPGQRRRSTRCPAAPATRTSSRPAACSRRRSASTERPFSAADAARTVTETAVETLRARGEPARFERLLGEILVGLDRAGQLRRLAARLAPADAAARGRRRRTTPTPAARRDATPIRRRRSRDARPPRRRRRRSAAAAPGTPRRRADGRAVRAPPRRRARRRAAPAAIGMPIRTRSSACSRSSATSSAGPTQRRLTRDRARPLVAGRPGRPRGRRRARSPTASSGPSSACCRPPARSPRPRSSSGSRRCSPATTCPTRASSGPASTATAAWPARPTGSSPATTCCAAARSTPSCWRALADGGHRLGMRVWIGRREQTPAARRRRPRRPARRRRAARLPRRHQPGRRRPRRGRLRSGTSAARSRFLFEVEWTAMLGEPLLRRHARIPPDDALVRFLVIAPERTELVRYKLARSPLLREALEARQLAHHQVEPPARVPRPRPARPGRPRAVPRARPGDRADAASRCRCSAADRPRLVDRR